MVGTTCVIGALILDIASYYRQIVKILRTKKSSQVSSTAYVYKICKGLLAMVGLVIYSNLVGMSMEIVMIVVYIICLVIISRFKPKGWKLF